MKNTKRTYGNVGAICCITFCFVVSLLGASYAADPPPNGSYKRTCKNIHYNADADRITSASCNNMAGKGNNTQFPNCNQCIASGGDISNCNGTLECTGANLPNVGSYKRSCWCCRMVGNSLGCYCNPKKGKSKWTTINNATSFSDIWNDDGQLKGR
jgi:CVNH domain